MYSPPPNHIRLQATYLSAIGFTLLEILMAISIFAIVVSLAYGSYRATFRIIDNTESQTKTYNQARIAMERISADLASLTTGPSSFLQAVPRASATPETGMLHFSSAAHLVFKKDALPAGSATITYLIGEDRETGTFQLFRRDKPLLPTTDETPDTSHGLLLCEGLKDIQFSYHLHDKDNQESWDSKEITRADTSAQRFPDSVEFTLLFAAPEPDGKPLKFTTAVPLPAALPKKDGNTL